ncbi:MAG: aminotransferase class I/II-fold pyridoxal phosphate-dependent enzyme, partial [Deltaproteobacteria bacterium]
MIRLDRNENPWGATAAVREAVKRALYAPYATTGINRYGDFNQTHLVRTIAAYHGVRPTEVTVGVGGSEILSILAAAFLQEGKLLLTAEPTFDLLPERARAWGGRVITVPLDPAGFYDLEALLGRVTGETRMIYLCNPNNPTGAFHDAAHLAAFTEEVWGRNPRTILVLDEAYIDYTVPEARFDFLPPLRRGRPIVVVRSLSAAHGMAGLRAGYALAN